MLEGIMTKRDGTTVPVRFTRKKEKILNLLKEGLTKKDLVNRGFNVNTVKVVASQAKRSGFLV